MAYTETTSIRPRNGKSAEAYWRIRMWCEKHGFSFSDVVNSLMLPLSYYLERSCNIYPDKNMAIVELNIGRLPILHCFGGKQYPLMSDKYDAAKQAYSIEDIQKRIDYWEEQNELNPQPYDSILAEEPPE